MTTIELYPFERGTIRCLKCESTDVQLRYRELDHAGPERLMCTCAECSFEWAMACKPSDKPMVSLRMPIPRRESAVDRMSTSLDEALVPAFESYLRTNALPSPKPKRHHRKR